MEILKVLWYNDYSDTGCVVLDSFLFHLLKLNFAADTAREEETRLFSWGADKRVFSLYE